MKKINGSQNQRNMKSDATVSTLYLHYIFKYIFICILIKLSYDLGVNLFTSLVNYIHYILSYDIRTENNLFLEHKILDNASFSRVI